MQNNEEANTRYQVVTIEKTTAPDGMSGSNWHRYIIQMGRSVIDCKKSGSLREVTEHANNVVEQINSRNK